MNLVGHRTRPAADVEAIFHSPATLLLWGDKQRALKDALFFDEEHVIACGILDRLRSAKDGQ